jgi:hypothetical protein
MDFGFFSAVKIDFEVPVLSEKWKISKWLSTDYVTNICTYG